MKSLYKILAIVSLALFGNLAAAVKSPAPQPAPAAISSATGVGVGVSSAEQELNNTVVTAIRNDISTETTNVLAQQQGQGQEQTAEGGSASANNAGNSLSSTNTYKQEKQVATAYAAAAGATASCVTGYGAGVQAQVAGFSFNRARRDPECVKEELANAAYTRGSIEAGNRIWCSIKLVYAALGDACLDLASIVNVKPSAPAVPETKVVVEIKQESDEERRAREDRIIKKVLSK